MKSPPDRIDSFFNFLNYVEEGGASHEWKDPNINWEGHFARARKLGIDSIIYYQMKQEGMLSQIPEEVQARWKARFYWSQVRNMKRFGRLKDVLRVFFREDIPVIALKGAVLAELVYPQKALRPMADVDLLVHEEDLNKAEQLLVSLGFRANEDDHSREWYRNCHHHIVPYVSRDNSLVIELHYELIDLKAPVKILAQDLWERSRQVDIAGVPCRILSPEDFLIHLSLHAAVDGYLGKIKVLYDLAETIKFYQKELDWEKLLKLVQDYNISKYLYYAFWLTKVTLRAGVPTTVLDNLKSKIRALPFEGRIVKAVIRKGIVLYERNDHPFYVWVLRLGCLDILSNQTRVQKLRNLIHRYKNRYLKFAQVHAQRTGVSLRWYLMVGYPVYLFRKAMGLSTSLEVTHPKKP